MPALERLHDSDRLVISFDLEDQNPLNPDQIFSLYICPALQAMAQAINNKGSAIVWRPQYIGELGVVQEIFEGAVPVLATAAYKCRGDELAGRTHITLETQVRAA